MGRRGDLAVAKYLKWLPNALTMARIVLGMTMFAVALHGLWVAGFWLLLVALSTDFLDGLAAKKLNAKTKFGEDLDGLADTFLGVFGLLSLAITGHLAWSVIALLLVIGAAIGSDRAFPNQPKWAWRTPVAVVSLFMVWIGILWFYAGIAFGWSWTYVPVTLVILAGCAVLKRHRIRAWLHQ